MKQHRQMFGTLLASVVVLSFLMSYLTYHMGYQSGYDDGRRDGRNASVYYQCCQVKGYRETIKRLEKVNHNLSDALYEKNINCRDPKIME